MHGLMTLWFGPLIELDADLGYFYLCPACHDEIITPELERIQNRILELHPAAQRHLEELDTTNNRQPTTNIEQPTTNNYEEDAEDAESAESAEDTESAESGESGEDTEKGS